MTPAQGPRDEPPATAWAVRGIVAVAAIGTLVAVLVALSSTGWRDRLVTTARANGPVVEAASGVPACAPVSLVPSGAARAAFVVGQVARPGTARVVLRGPGDTVSRPGPPVRIGAPGTVRPLLPRGARTDESRQVCLVPDRRARFQVVGQDGRPALRLTGATRESWFDVLPDVVARSTNGTGAPARWLGLVGAFVLALAAIALAVAVVLRARRTPGPRRASRRVVVALVLAGVLQGLAWGILVPPFQTPDEPVHLQYAAYVADHGKIPTGDPAIGALAGPDQSVAQAATAADIVARGDIPPPWSGVEDRRLRRALADLPAGPVPNASNTATGQPPLYYAVAGAIDAVAPGNVLDRLSQMRLLGAVLLGALVLGVLALARRLVPDREEWALSAAAVVAAFPLLGFAAGGLNPDLLMVTLGVWAVVAALALVERPTFRRGAAVAALGALVVLAKLNGVAIVPALVVLVGLALVTAARRSWPDGSTGAVLGLLAGVAVPAALYVAWCLVSDRPLVPGALVDVAQADAGPGAGRGGGPAEFVSYSWQLFAPRLPFQQDLIEGFPLDRIWFDGLVGRYGWLDYAVPGWMATVLRPVVIVAAVGAVVGAVRVVRGWLARRDEAAARGAVVAVALGLVLLGTLFAIARADYTAYLGGGQHFWQARYLLLALPAFVAGLLLLFRAVGPRFARPVAAVVVCLVAAQLVASLVVTAGRYYG